MFAKVTRLGRRSIRRRRLESTQDATEITDQLQSQREVVDIAPDLLRRCSLETPFPSVAFGGYRKYYKAREPTTYLKGSRNYPIPPPTIPFAPMSQERSSETKPLKVARKTRRYSFSNSSSISKKSAQLFRWKRATCIITSNINDRQLSPILSRSPDSDAGRPSFEVESSQSSQGSSDSSTSDSIAFEFRRTSPDSDSTLIPISPISIYSNDEPIGIVVESNDNEGSEDVRIRRWSLRRPISSSSYWTAKSVFSEG